MGGKAGVLANGQKNTFFVDKYTPHIYHCRRFPRKLSQMLIGTGLINEFIDSVIHTGFLKTDSPQSAMLIATPESGKTSIVEDKNCRSVAVVSDMIGSGILDELAQKSYLRHIVINDMVAVMAHKEVTNQRTFAVMSALTEEGLGRVMLPGGLAMDFGRRKIGFICCIPTELAMDNRRWWNRSGFSSRFIPFNYEYSEALQLEIKRTIIISGAYETKNGMQRTPVPNKRFDVDIDEKRSKEVQSFADAVAERLGEKGIRRGKQLRALVRGHALIEKRLTVGPEDISFLKRLVPHLNYTNSTELEYARTKVNKE